jgi:hypothetical protein
MTSAGRRGGCTGSESSADQFVRVRANTRRPSTTTAVRATARPRARTGDTTISGSCQKASTDDEKPAIGRHREHHCSSRNVRKLHANVDNAGHNLLFVSSGVCVDR